jgi:mono/diheme cytochrome c family protein
MKINRLLLLAGICFVLIFSCKHDPQYIITNPPLVNCDTTNVTYAASVVPILNTNCTVCHGTANYASSGGGFKIVTYTDFAGFAKSGLMMNSLNGVGGLNSMPKGGNKLSACDIAKIGIVVRKILDTLNATTPPPVSKCSPDTIYFTNTLGPLILNSCGLTTSRCHNTGGNSPLLTTYANIRANVVPGSPSSSRLYTVLSGTGENAMPRSPVSPFTAAQKLLVYNWIMQGAKNNSCVDATCDTTTVTYSGTIASIFSTNCIGCHSSSGTSTTKLDSYTGAKAAVTAGRILGAIQHVTGYTAMPPGGQLSTCDIGKIKAWIYRGALNN